MSTLTQGELQVRSAIPIMNIQKFHMEINKNCHGFFQLEGIVPEDMGEEILLWHISGTNVMIGAGEEVLFTGILKEVQISKEGQEYRAIMTGVSATEQLDHRRKSRTFQDVSMTYCEVIEQVLADTPGARLLFHKAEEKIGKPIYQIDETDWEFMKRLAGIMRTAIVPSVYSGSACVHIGLPKGRSRDADISETVSERIWMDKGRKGICRGIRTGENWEVGDRVNWGGTECFVITKECRLEKGLLNFYYTLAGAETFVSESYENSCMAGMLLPATVLAVEEESVKVKFDMDKEQSVESAYQYPWRPDIGNLMYCMPEKGERIYVLMGDSTGTEARAVCGVHRNGAGNSEMDNASRYFTTADRKRMYLTPESIGFQDMKQKKMLKVELKDGTGTNIVSHCKLTISAADTVGLKGNKVLFQSPQEISLVKKAASPTVINMCNGFDSVGATNKVTMEGAGEENFPVFHQSEAQTGKEYGLEEKEVFEKTIIASTPAMELTDSVVRKLKGCQVDRLEPVGEIRKNYINPLKKGGEKDE